MQIVADLHLHSRYSRAVSPKMNLQEMATWAVKKGIDLLTTGDWTHPVWLQEIKLNLIETQKGIFKLKSPLDPREKNVSFILSAELESIYSRGDKVRRVHNLLFAPSLNAVEKFNQGLEKRGAKLMSDGRPKLGISSNEILKMALEIDKDFMLIPAHAWTPWYGIFGSQSGFDSLEEAFGEQKKYIYAVETGLSSDPIMNWKIEELIKRSIVSFSDAHSAPKLGREATVFISNSKDNIPDPKTFSYKDLLLSIKRDPVSRFKIGYTIEFFPEHGKYHWTGHRNCNLKYSPEETKEKGFVCPVCGRRLVIGVENRVLDLSFRNYTKEDLMLIKNSVGTTMVFDKEKKRTPFISLIPLLEILLEVNNNSPTKTLAAYENLTATFGTEFDILIKKPYDEIKTMGGERLEQAVRIVRERNAFVDPGYDGVFGKVKIFKDSDGETNSTSDQEKQLGLF